MILTMMITMVMMMTNWQWWCHDDDNHIWSQWSNKWKCYLGGVHASPNCSRGIHNRWSGMNLHLDFVKKRNWANKRLVPLITSGMAMSKAGWRTLSLIRFGWWTSFTLGKPRDLKLNWSSSSILGEDKELEGLQEVEVEDKEELMELLHSRRTSDPLVVIFTHTFQLSLDYLLKKISLER